MKKTNTKKIDPRAIAELYHSTAKWKPWSKDEHDRLREYVRYGVKSPSFIKEHDPLFKCRTIAAIGNKIERIAGDKK